MSSKLRQEYEAQLLNLRGKVSDLTDELISAKRQLGDDNTELLLSHEKEKRELEKSKDEKISELKEQIGELKTELRFKELENRQDSGQRSIPDRVMDILEHNLGDDFLPKLADRIGELMKTQQTPGQLAPKQLQQAMAQAVSRQNAMDNAPQPQKNPNSNPQSNGADAADLPPMFQPRSR
jgi:hypothetical protein